MMGCARPAIERLFRIRRLIIAGRGPVNATTLAAQLETSRKTIHRDLEFLRDRLGLPLEYDHAEHTWRFIKGDRFDLMA
jgi:predicted DNA-binding transcriptional regulator YafY